MTLRSIRACFMACAFTLSTLLASPVAAQEPRPDPPVAAASNQVEGLSLPPDQTVDPKEYFAVVVAITDSDDVHWIVVGTTPVKYDAVGKRISVALPPGSVIHLYAYATVGGKATGAARTVLTVKGGAVPPAPPPGPQPGPGPQPPPQPPPAVVGALNVVIVEDPLARNKYPWLGAILNNSALEANVKKAGHTWRVIDVRDPEVQRAKLGPHIQTAGGTPALILMDAAGNVYKPQQVPQTPEAFVAAVNAAARGEK